MNQAGYGVCLSGAWRPLYQQMPFVFKRPLNDLTLRGRQVVLGAGHLTAAGIGHMRYTTKGRLAWAGSMGLVQQFQQVPEPGIPEQLDESSKIHLEKGLRRVYV